MKTKWRVGQQSPQNTWHQVYHLCTEGDNLEILPRGFIMQRQILINVIFVAYVLNLLLNTQRKMEPGFRLMTVARYMVLPLISWYHCLDPTVRDILRVHCNRTTIKQYTLNPTYFFYAICSVITLSVAHVGLSLLMSLT